MSARKQKPRRGRRRAFGAESSNARFNLAGLIIYQDKFCPTAQHRIPPAATRNASLNVGARAHMIYALFRFARVRRVSRM
jgi:hypothetical protein